MGHKCINRDFAKASVFLSHLQNSVVQLVCHNNLLESLVWSIIGIVDFGPKKCRRHCWSRKKCQCKAVESIPRHNEFRHRSKQDQLCAVCYHGNCWLIYPVNSSSRWNKQCNSAAKTVVLVQRTEGVKPNSLK